jgi:hypothetical protein
MTYRDILARKERQRVDGSGPVWPLRREDMPSHYARAVPARREMSDAA